MIRYFRTPWFTRLWYPELFWRIPSADAIYLTFDDGPHPKVTPWVLETLKEFNAKATFFCLGKNLEANADIAKRIMQEGHQIGNHTFKHSNGWKVLNWDYQEDIRACDAELMKLDIHNQLFRPPYGRIRKSQLSSLKNRRIVMWSHLSWDFDQKLNVEKSIRQLKKAGPGSILVFHDSAKAFNNLKEILPEILSHFQAKGFKFKIIL